jgi:hypothetical protein
MPDHDIELDLPGVGDVVAEDGASQSLAEPSEPSGEAEPLESIEALATGLPAWKLAGLMRHQRWAAGKAVSRATFDAALAAFEGRPLGGGR